MRGRMAGSSLESQAGASPSPLANIAGLPRAKASRGRQGREARAGGDTPLIPSSSLHPIISLIHLSHPSSCVSKTVSIALEKKTLSRPKLLFKLGTKKQSKMSLVSPGSENTVHICVLFGILSVVQSCVLVQS